MHGTVRKWPGRLMALLLAFGLVGGVVVLGTSSPALAVGCYGDYCSGQDPASTNCGNDAYTVRSVTVNEYDYNKNSYYDVGTLEVRWSPTCKTNWARLSTWRSSKITALHVTQDTGYDQKKQTYGAWGGTSAGVFWTPMIYSPVHRVYAHVDTFWPTTCSICATSWV